MSEPTGIMREAPWRAGLRAVRANVVPGLIVQGAMVVLLVLYYFHPPSHGVFVRLAETKAAWGFGYSVLAAAVAGALVPELLRIVINQRGRVMQKNFEELLFTVPFWGGMGFVVDVFYRYQAQWFGDEPLASVVIPQVLVDQFLYNPLFAAPVTVWLFAWKNRGYRMTRDFFTARYYRGHIVPALFATWGVWIPVVTVLYLLPEPVQIPLFSLALSLWAILYAWMSDEQARRATA
ncbi:hypothetical protein OKA05_28410 [Luteolibacter arcticus]|uniref:Uncharacterized protein n=1 Tax=Luteolibacter arcticus TaxID=1581411 RepID=A0ABT3GSR0_9BACT|nr:hypothetical protein [Luteolibacter arcticus]MCW1926508.1 hypothetical protein [Luteolibacter arcticus]